MIDYKLAKQLKKAGFPQNLHERDGTNGDWIGIGNGKDVLCPTLSELIEATKQKDRCLELEENQQWWGNDFDEKTGTFKTDKKGKWIKKLQKDYHWVAKLVDWDGEEYGGRRCFESGDEVVVRTEGKTPEEAVAKLWLKLNKKK